MPPNFCGPVEDGLVETYRNNPGRQVLIAAGDLGVPGFEQTAAIVRGLEEGQSAWQIGVNVAAGGLPGPNSGKAVNAVQGAGTGVLGMAARNLDDAVETARKKADDIPVPSEVFPSRPPRTVSHQGGLPDGVFPHRSLSTSPDQDLNHYHSEGELYRLDIPDDVNEQWFMDGSIQLFNDLHLPSGKIRPEIRIMPPASGQMNGFLVPRGGG